jgi:hypothetical protein
MAWSLHKDFRQLPNYAAKVPANSLLYLYFLIISNLISLESTKGATECIGSIQERPPIRDFILVILNPINELGDNFNKSSLKYMISCNTP